MHPAGLKLPVSCHSWVDIRCLLARPSEIYCMQYAFSLRRLRIHHKSPSLWERWSASNRIHGLCHLEEPVQFHPLAVVCPLLLTGCEMVKWWWRPMVVEAGQFRLPTLPWWWRQPTDLMLSPTKLVIRVGGEWVQRSLRGELWSAGRPECQTLCLDCCGPLI